MTNMPPLDFTKVEALRKHMLLKTSNMAELLGVSRMTYYGWTQGKTIRKKNDERVRVALKELLGIMSEGWPQPEVIALDPKARFQRLLEILGKQG